MSKDNPLLSVVVPVYNEQEVIAETAKRLRGVLDGMSVDYEIVFVNDGSRDGTLSVLRPLCEADARLKLVNFSRNFGHQIAITAGMDMTRGDAVVVIDADLQDPPEVIPGMFERTVTLNGFSKAFAMTGWRMGYACAPKEILDVMMRVHQYTIMCAPTAGQYAAVEALKSGLETDFADVKRMVRQYDRRRRVIVDGLRAAGLETHEPLGAFYAFPCVRSTGMTSQEFCVRLLEEERVACVPGDAFGETGEGYVRCSYASSLENITEAVRRIGAFTARHRA